MVVVPRVMVTPRVSGSHVTVEPKVSAMKRIGTKVWSATISGAASTEVALPSTVTMSVPTVRTMTILTATGTVVIVTRPAASMVTVAVAVRPPATAVTVPVSAVEYVRRPCVGATLEITATGRVSDQAAGVVYSNAGYPVAVAIAANCCLPATFGVAGTSVIARLVIVCVGMATTTNVPLSPVLSVAVIKAAPVVLRPITSPALVTFATNGLLDVHVAGVTTAPFRSTATS